MSDFNYQEYLKNNPLLQKEAEENKLITESQEAEESHPHMSSDEFLRDIEKLHKDNQTQMAKEKKVEEKDINLTQDEMDDLHSKGELEKGEDKISYKMKVSELKAKIKEDILSLLNEDEDEEVEAAEDEIEMDDAEVDVEADVEAPAPTAPAGLSSDEQDIQSSLKVAYDKAVAIGDEKLADQIGNSITFFTRSHVVER